MRNLLLTLLAGLVISACASVGPPDAAPDPADPERADAPGLPPVPEVRGELEIRVVYPSEGGTVAAVDSTFVFGSVGHGEAELTVNGEAVEVAPNGAWLAFLPVPEDGRYELEASVNGRTERTTRQVNIAALPTVDAEPGRLGVVPGSLTPAGTITRVRGERVEVRIQATPGARAHLLLPDGTRVPLNERGVTERQAGFMLDRAVARDDVSEYVGSFPLDAPLLAEDTRIAPPTLAQRTGHVEPGEVAPATCAVVELVLDADTLRVPLEASVGVLEADVPRVVVTATDRPDSTTVARREPGPGAPYEHFWPNGTPLEVTGETGGFYRVRLADDLTTWVQRGDVELAPPGFEPPRADVGPTIGVEHHDEWIDLEIGMSRRLPFRVEPRERGITLEFYRATGRPGYVHYGADDTFVDRIHWEQPDDDRFLLHLELKERLWGFRSRWDEGARLVLQVRRPPRMDPADPLAGLHLAIDAGHPPGGATGPTGLTEAEANRNVTRHLVPMLEERGARVLDIRPDTAAVALIQRPLMATENNAHLLVSVHFNAFPDGVNPFEHNGTIMFHYWPQSVPFARHLQREIVEELGIRDLGTRFQNLALPRTMWMPSVLTESAFMMIPEQEAAMRDDETMRRLAEAHLRGIESFLREVADEQR